MKAVDKSNQTPLSDPNAWGLYDMHGNVWEWCEENAAGSSGSSGNGNGNGKEKPIRGGAWTSTNLLDCRSASRSTQPADKGTAAIGFRVLLENPDAR